MASRNCGMTALNPVGGEAVCRKPEYHDGDHIADVDGGTVMWGWPDADHPDPEFVPHPRVPQEQRT